MSDGDVEPVHNEKRKTMLYVGANENTSIKRTCSELQKFRYKGASHVLVTIFISLLIGACGSIGPRTMDKDQLDYGRSIGDSWKNQMLANLVKLRFVDMPVFLDVGQIVSGYSLEAAVTGSLNFTSGSDSQTLGASGKYTDRPTITYTPKIGEDYLSTLLEPVRPTALLALIAAGYDPELLFTWALESVNGMKNFSSHTVGKRDADAEFLEIVRLLAELVQSGDAIIEIREDPEAGTEAFLRFVDKNSSPEAREKKGRAISLMGLDESVSQYRIIYPSASMDADVIAMQTRSVLQMLLAMSGFVDVPDDKRAWAGRGFALPEGEKTKLFHISSGPSEPGDVFAKYRYQGDWYWIDHTDLPSKRVFTMMLFITTLTTRAGSSVAPVLTIPTG